MSDVVDAIRCLTSSPPDGLRSEAQTHGSVEAEPAPLPDRIDRFRILRIIGEGGMGLVYEARQESPD